MSDEKVQQEPSMEDILASIRRILSEDDIEDSAQVEAKPAAAKPAAAKPAAAKPAVASKPTAPPVAEAPLPPQPSQPIPQPPEAEFDDDVLELTDEMMTAVPEEASPVLRLDPNEFADFDAPSRESNQYEEEEEEAAEADDERLSAIAPASLRPFLGERMPADAERLIASEVEQASTTALSELARAVARERGVGLGSRGLTLEDLVRDLLRPILKDWLDQNLPYMIERIVRKEIERMVNRAEKL